MSLVNIYCPVCQNNKFNTFEKVFDDRYGEPNQYNLAECINCKHVSTYPRLNQEELGKLYQNYYPRKNISYKQVLEKSNTNNSIFRVLQLWFHGTNNQGQIYAKKGENVLDIGCGDCSSLLEIKKLGANPYGIETDLNILPIANKLNLKVHFGSIEDNPFPGKFFELIVMNQVIEHFPEPDKSLQLIKKRLSPNGRLIIVIPNKDSIWQKITGKKWINWHIPYHLHHFSKKNFEKMLKKSKLKIINYRTITPNVWTFLQIRHIYHNTKIGEVNKIWQKEKHNKHSKFKQEEKLIFAKKFIKFSLLLFIALVNRIIDFLNLGDSLMVELEIKN